MDSQLFHCIFSIIKNDKESNKKVIHFKLSIIQYFLGVDVIQTWRHVVTCMVSYDSHIIIKTFIILPYDSYCIYEWIYLRSQWVIVRGIAISRDESLSHQELIDYSWWISFAIIWIYAIPILVILFQCFIKTFKFFDFKYKELINCIIWNIIEIQIVSYKNNMRKCYYFL